MNKLRPGAQAGHSPSQVLLAQLLEAAGLLPEAAGLYRRAAESGNAEGQYALGAMLAEGRGLDRDEPTARQWIERAATAGHAGAINYLAQSYMRGGLGLVPPRSAGAPGLLTIKQSAASGHLPAIDYLAQGYRSGAFGEIDLKQAEAFEAQAEKLRAVGKRARPAEK
jgi:TPR repeat protein